MCEEALPFAFASVLLLLFSFIYSMYEILHIRASAVISADMMHGVSVWPHMWVLYADGATLEAFLWLNFGRVKCCLSRPKRSQSLVHTPLKTSLSTRGINSPNPEPCQTSCSCYNVAAKGWILILAQFFFWTGQAETPDSYVICSFCKSISYRS